VIYQDILEQGLQRGRQEGRQEGETLLVVRLLKRRIGLLEDELETRIRSLRSCASRNNPPCNELQANRTKSV
jgi:predicted transposase YdaD